MKTIFIDIDDVVTDTMARVISLLGLPESAYDTIRRHPTKHGWITIPGLDPSIVTTAVESVINACSSQPVDGVKIAMHRLEQHGCRPVFLSARPVHLHAMTHAMLRNQLGHVDFDVFCVGSSARKLDILGSYPGCLLVDDTLPHKDIDRNSFVFFSKPWNSDIHGGFRRIDNWSISSVDMLISLIKRNIQK